jgi:hypothetical protein
MVDFSSRIIANNFFSNDILGHFDNLFKHEELHERLSFVFEHRNFTKSILGDSPKLFFKDWSNDKKTFKLRGNEIVKFKIDEKQKNNSELSSRSFAESRHDENKVISIIQNILWEKAKWKGFGPFSAPNVGFGIFLAFENGNAGKSIFEEWIKRFGKEDKDDIIKLTIIKGVNKKNPFWYKVHITANIHSQSFSNKERYIAVAARFHQMTPTNSENIQKIEQLIRSKSKFLFCPGELSKDGKDVEPYFDYAIIKSTIEIINAWELSLNDPACVVIQKDDDPMIPPGIKNAPILEIIKKGNNN